MKEQRFEFIRKWLVIRIFPRDKHCRDRIFRKSNEFNWTRGDEPICYRGPLCQLPLSKRAAQLFSHTIKAVKKEKKVHQQKQTTRLLVSPECFAGRMFVTSALNYPYNSTLLSAHKRQKELSEYFQMQIILIPKQSFNSQMILTPKQSLISAHNQSVENNFRWCTNYWQNEYTVFHFA